MYETWPNISSYITLNLQKFCIVLLSNYVNMWTMLTDYVFQCQSVDRYAICYQIVAKMNTINKKKLKREKVPARFATLKKNKKNKKTCTWEKHSKQSKVLFPSSMFHIDVFALIYLYFDSWDQQFILMNINKIYNCTRQQLSVLFVTLMSTVC